MIEARYYVSRRFIHLFSEPPSKTDVENINALLTQLSKSPRQLTETKLKELVHKPGFFLLTARASNNDIVGMASLIIYETLLKKVGVIEDVVVDQGHRGKGIARRLLETLIETARSAGVYCIDLTSHPDRTEANNPYTKIGFQKRGTNCYRLVL